MGDIDFRFYLSILLKRLPLFLLAAVSMLTIGLTVALFTPPVYRASARILVEAPQIPNELARSTVSTNALEQMQVTRQQITTRAYLLDLTQRFHIYDPTKRFSDADIVDNMQSRVLLEQVNIDGLDGQGASVFGVSFDAKDPVLAANVVNDIVSFILGKNKSLRTDRAEDTQRFFEQEVKRLGGELNRIESAVLKFKNDNSDALPDGLDFRRNEQSRLQERLLLLEREGSGLRSRRGHIVEVYESTGTVMSAGPLTPEQQLLQDLKRSLSEQLTIFSEGSPTIVALRARVADLQKEQQKANPDGSKATPGSSELAMQLSEIDERLEFIAKEGTHITSNLAGLEKSIAATPNNESTLLALQRDHENFQSQYNAAVANLAQASTGEQIEARSKGVRFSMVEPATPPQNPVSPKRRIIAAAGLFGGLAGGIGLIVLLELLNKSMRRPQELVQSLGIQPLVTVAYIWLDGEKRNAMKRTTYLSAAATALVPVLLITVHFSYMPIGSVLERIMAVVDGSRM